MSVHEKIDPKSSPDQIPLVDLYEPYKRIYTRRVSGFYQRLRQYTGIPLLLAYFLTPWLSIDGRPAMLFDLSAQQFHIFWMSFWPQDGYLLALLLMVAAFALFSSTLVVGRIWCGFSCPQTVWTLMFMWAENRCEGDRNRRIKLDQQPWSTEKVARKVAKHGIWILISLATGLTFIAYFYGIRELLLDIATLVAPIEAYAWVLFFAAATYINAGYLRDQVCKYMCPYARFQSVMYDDDTLLVSYDEKRGETRGSAKKADADTVEGQGDCIDCSWCVQVCPVDIDIRAGLQFECIDCGLCADACDQVMDKMGWDRGLIAFTTQQALSGGRRRIWRPRLLGYLAATFICAGIFIYALASRVPLSVDVIRDRSGALYQQAAGAIENIYTVKINNMGQGRQQYLLRADSIDGNPVNYRIRGPQAITLDEGETGSLAIRVRLPKAALSKVNNRIYFTVNAVDQPTLSAGQLSSFIGPSP